MEHNHINGKNAGCDLCRNNLPFDFPSELLNDVIEGKVVIFAGAGISTENRSVFPNTFYEDVSYEIGIQSENGPSFPDIMSKYCARRNGRTLLLQKIKKRFDYVKSFPELYRTATRFHKELATIYLIDSIITTNWDDYFEIECGAMPIFTAEDFAFWNMPGRKVYKIHGSVNSYSSIIATREDYDKCYSQLTSGLIGSYLKVMLATKTIIYIGFSFRDDDLIKISKLLSEEMGEIRPCSYIVTIDQNSDDRFKELGLIPIYTDGEYFIQILKNELIKQNYMLDDKEFEAVECFLNYVSELHEELSNKIDLTEHPESLYLFLFQDGLLHSFERVLALKNTGYYSNPRNIIVSIDNYSKKRKEILGTGHYFDVAYIDGYLIGLMYLLEENEMREYYSPFYIFGFKDDIKDFDEYKCIIKNAPQIHKAAYRYAVKIVKEKIINKGIILHHSPFL